MRAARRNDYAIEQLLDAAEKEVGFGRAAPNIMRKERPNAVSRKDRGPGNALTALRAEDGSLLVAGTMAA